ncbi:ATP-binding protein [Mesorhizobium sp. WSM2239]|uniref:histidine kinase n=2 Tax=unclassified Mesorhizobium TaxID=325217 RepID=A0AAU8D8J4_9HYPH
MPSEAYSFIDVVVLDEVRERFAAGDALAILSTDLEQVIWANGPGAALFGHDDIEAIIGAPSRLSLPARRQIMAVRGYPDIGRDRPLMVRMTTGVTSHAVAFIASALTLPDGEKAILLAAPIAQAASRGPAEAAERAIGGFNEPGHFVAFIDGRGEVEAASAGFDELGISHETLAALVAEIGGGPERIARRVIRGGSARLPAGLARLTDEPARHLLVVIDERRAAGEEFATDEGADGAQPAGREQEPEPVAGADAIEQDNSATRAAAEPAAAPAADEKPTPDVREKPAGEAPAQLDNWYFSAAREPSHDQSSQVGEQPETREAETPAPVATERATTPVRFVWRTDAEGRFSAVSPEFADAVGALAADVVGRRFEDVAATFALDPSGDIAGLLDRRDTWSGRSVLWPVAGTALKIPVDLAALPVYGRDRDFQGFRGFGVARSGDAVADPEEIGMVLVAPPEKTAAAQPAEPPAETPQHETDGSEPDTADPFKGEVPALAIVPKPDRRFADKVIRLAEHRQSAPERGGLSSIERSAFREIGERLRLIGEPTAPEQAEATATQEATPAAEKTAADAAGKAQPPSPVAEAPTAEAEMLEEAAKAAAEARSKKGEATATPSEAADETPPAAEAPAQQLPEPIAPAEDQAATEPVAAVEIEEAAEAAAEEITEPGESEAVEAEAKAEPSEPAENEPDAEEGAEVPEPVELSGAAESDGVEPGEAAEPSEAGEAAEAEPRKILAANTGILAKLPVPVLIHSGDALHYANDEFLHLTGYDSVEQLAEAGGLDALFSAPYGDDQHDEADRSLRLSTRDGLEFPIDALLRSVPWNGGKALMLVVRRTGEEELPAEPAPDRSAEVQELRTRLAEMRTIIDTATDGVVLIANDGSIRSISRPAEALFSFDSDEVAGKPFISLFAIESQRAARDYLNGLSDHGVASVLNDGREVIGREAQGRFIPLFMTIGKLPNDSGYCAVVRDITQWKRAEEELTQARALAERASSQKTDFLARVSHEIRTPLNAIIGFSELMVDERFGPIANDRYRDYLRDINRSGNHVLDLVNDLLDISKIEAGQQEMAYEAVSLNDTLAETVAMMQPQANRERVIIRSSFASKLPEVVADLRSVRQIALNILSNAVRYTQAGGQVIISTAYEPSGDVVIRMRDTGVGMSQAEIEQALKPFKQINSLKRTRGDGTGLGLPLTKAMVEANRARFSINSTPGEGTLVEITFPSTRVLAD